MIGCRNFAGMSLALSLCLVAGRVEAQDLDLKIPEYVGQFEAVVDSVSVVLERQTPEIMNDVKSLGFGGVETRIRFRGERSPVRLNSAAMHSFVVRVSSQDTDPAELIQFYKLSSGKGSRSMPMYNIGSAGNDSARRQQDARVPFSAKKYGTKSFIVTNVSKLPPGEYMLSTVSGSDGFLFGVN